MVIAANRMDPRKKLEMEVKAKMRSPSAVPPLESSLDMVERPMGGADTAV